LSDYVYFIMCSYRKVLEAKTHGEGQFNLVTPPV